MKFGLRQGLVDKIIEAIASVEEVDQATIYGSRAKGNYSNGSDIDITLLGDNLTLNNSVYPLMDELDELYLPYTFDISIFNQIDNKDLIDHIKRVGKVFYENKTGLPKGWEVKKTT